VGNGALHLDQYLERVTSRSSKTFDASRGLLCRDATEFGLQTHKLSLELMRGDEVPATLDLGPCSDCDKAQGDNAKGEMRLPSLELSRNTTPLNMRHHAPHAPGKNGPIIVSPPDRTASGASRASGADSYESVSVEGDVFPRKLSSSCLPGGSDCCSTMGAGTARTWWEWAVEPGSDAREPREELGRTQEPGAGGQPGRLRASEPAESVARALGMRGAEQPPVEEDVEDVKDGPACAMQTVEGVGGGDAGESARERGERGPPRDELGAAAALSPELASEEDKLAPEEEILASEEDKLAPEEDKLASEEDKLASEEDKLAPEEDSVAIERAFEALSGGKRSDRKCREDDSPQGSVVHTHRRLDEPVQRVGFSDDGEKQCHLQRQLLEGAGQTTAKQQPQAARRRCRSLEVERPASHEQLDVPGRLSFCDGEGQERSWEAGDGSEFEIAAVQLLRFE